MIKKIYLTLKAIKNIQTAVLDFLGFFKNQYTIYKLRNGTEIKARTKSCDLGEVVIINADLEYPEKYFPTTNNPIIVDIGANIGLFSIYVNNHLYQKKPIIYAVEPSKQNFELLNQNLKLNNYKNIKSYKCAISDYLGKGNLDLSASPDSYSLSKSKKNELVAIYTIEEFCKIHQIYKIDLLKIDIEGEEEKVFYKSIDFFEKRVRSIFVEIHKNVIDQEKFEKIIDSSSFKIVDFIENRTYYLVNSNL